MVNIDHSCTCSFLVQIEQQRLAASEGTARPVASELEYQRLTSLEDVRGEIPEDLTAAQDEIKVGDWVG